MQINKAKLQEALEIVKPGLANKEIIEQTTSFAFIDGRVVTYNDEISISHPVEGLEIEGAVKADKLYQLLAKIKHDEITASIEGSELILQSGKSKAGMSLVQEIKLPLDEEIAHQEDWKTLPATFEEYIGFSMSSCSRDMSDPVLTCINVTKSGFVQASDGYRIIQCALGKKMPVGTFLLPATSAMKVIKIHPTKIAEGHGWIHFGSESGTIISCRIFEDKYPDIAPHFDVKGVEVILPKTMDAMLDRAAVFAKRDHMLDESIEITLQPGVLKIRSEADSGWYEEEVAFRYKGDKAVFYITPYLLRGILAKTLVGVLSASKLKFEGPSWQYITLLRNA